MCEIIRIVCCPEPRVSSIFTLVAEDGFVMANKNKHISLPAPLSDGDPVDGFEDSKYAAAQTTGMTR